MGEWNEQVDPEQGIGFLEEGTAYAKTRRLRLAHGRSGTNLVLNLGCEEVMKDEAEGSRDWVTQEFGGCGT